MHKKFQLRPCVIFSCLLAWSFLMSGTSPASAEQGSKWKIFPASDVFPALVADPKEPRFFVSVHEYDNEFRDNFTGASVGFGENFGLLKKRISNRHAWQLSLKGGLFSQFDLDTSSQDLLNSDYNIGLSWTYRFRQIGMRLRLYHQSSHLGDEYLLRQPNLAETRANFDYEALDWLGAYTWNKFRTYAGLHYLLQRDPDDLDRWGYHGGIEYRGTDDILARAGFIAGLDVKGFQELAWTPAYSLKAGLNFSNINQRNRHIQVMLEYYNGFIPYGQFYDNDMESYGIGIYFGL